MTNLLSEKTSHRQIAFDLSGRPAMAREDFLVAPSNQDAVAWIDLWPEWPAPALILYGPPASGKTHLCAVWAAKSKATTLSVEELLRRGMRESVAERGHLVLEDIDSCLGNMEEENILFHLYNLCKEEERGLLLTMKEPPIRQCFLLPDLASRLRAVPAVAIRPPDEQLLEAVIVKLFADRQVRVGEDVLRYITSRIERSFEAVREVVLWADRESMIRKRPVSIPLVRSFFENKPPSDGPDGMEEF